MASGVIRLSPAGPPIYAGEWDFRSFSHRARRSRLVLILLPTAWVVGTVCALHSRLMLTVGFAVGLAVFVWRRPARAGYLIVVLTPLLAGINRGSALPVLRPSEALALLVGGTLALRAVVCWRSGELPVVRLDRLGIAMLAMAVCSSIVPLLWMLLRQQTITSDDEQ